MIHELIEDIVVWFYPKWDWFLYYRHGKIKYKIWDMRDSYCAFASNGIASVGNCYGSTYEQAKEVATVRLNQAMIDMHKEKEIIDVIGGVTISRRN